MMNQNEEYEDMPVEEKKKKQELREAGMDVNGEFSMDSMKKWFRRAEELCQSARQQYA